MMEMHKGCTDNQFCNLIVQNFNLHYVTVPWWDVDLSSNFELYHYSLDPAFDINFWVSEMNCVPFFKH